MQTIRSVSELRRAVAALRADGTIALVPTMGALHAGHMTLVAEAARRARHVVVSIFVNPTQFGAGEDLDAYPRQEAADGAMLEGAGVAILWAPTVEEMYPDGFATSISVKGVSEGLCGAARPGHFDGVATVVAKLLGQVRPDVALFGEKDWQQLAVIRRMVCDLDLDVEIVGVPIARDDDGLALSSRNVYLGVDQRRIAALLPRALASVAQSVEAGESPADAITRARTGLENSGIAVEYFELRDAASLGEAHSASPARLLVAARVGTTRLIDNRPVALP